MGHRGKRRLRAPERRAQLLAVARTVFAREGYEGASIEAIARRAGVSRPVVYSHFRDKADLFEAVLRDQVDQLTALVREAVSRGTPRERFERAVLTFFRYAAAHPEGYRLLSREAPRRHGGDVVSGLFGPVADRITVVMAEALAAAGYDPRHAPVYTQALLGMVSRVGAWWMEARQGTAEDVAAHVAALGWTGLRGLPRRPSLAVRDGPDAPDG